MGVLDESADYLQDLKAVRVDTLETRRLRIYSFSASGQCCYSEIEQTRTVISSKAKPVSLHRPDLDLLALSEYVSALRGHQLRSSQQSAAQE